MKRRFMRQGLRQYRSFIVYVAMTLCFVFLMQCSPWAVNHAAATGSRAVVAAADQSGGYANAVLDKVVANWRPPQENDARIVRIVVMVDGDGKLTDCLHVTKSGSLAADKAACNAARAVGTFATPPYNLPVDVYLSFWTGNPTFATGGISHGTPPALASNAPPINEPVVIPSSPEPAVEEVVIPPVEQSQRTYPSSHKPTIQDARSGGLLDEKDYYIKRIMGKIAPLVTFPSTMPKGKFSTSITVRVDAEGNFLKVTLEESSGVSTLDTAIVQAANQIAKVHAPPSKKTEDLYLTFVVDNP